MSLGTSSSMGIQARKPLELTSFVESLGSHLIISVGQRFKCPFGVNFVAMKDGEMSVSSRQEIDHCRLSTCGFGSLSVCSATRFVVVVEKHSALASLSEKLCRNPSHFVRQLCPSCRRRRKSSGLLLSKVGPASFVSLASPRVVDQFLTYSRLFTFRSS